LLSTSRAVQEATNKGTAKNAGSCGDCTETTDVPQVGAAWRRFKYKRLLALASLKVK
jgi:hypothetical protein